MRTQLVAASALAALASCGTTRSGHAWGETATLLPGRDRFAQAARDAALDPWTWGPAAAALVVSIDDWDEEISDWARDETPLFGSTEGASDASHDYRAAAQDAWLLSMLAVPSGDRGDLWLRNKVQGFAIEWSATWATSELTSLIKDASNRERPDGSDDRSFPSGHASAATAYCSLAWRNLRETPMPDPLRYVFGAGLVVAAGGTAWARVEQGAHFPSDVFAGAALGNFVARFVHDSFLGSYDAVQITAFADPERGDWSVGVAWSH